eukprot:535391_1
MGNKNSNTNKTSHNENGDFIKMYSYLINMGFDETKSIEAANKYPNNLNKAIDYINKSKSKINNKNKDERKQYNEDLNQNEISNNTQHQLQSKIMNKNNNDEKNDECIMYNDDVNQNETSNTIQHKSKDSDDDEKKDGMYLL